MSVKLTHEDLDVPGLCAEKRILLRTIIGNTAFDPRRAAMAYIEAGHSWVDIPRAYAGLVRAGRLPDVGLVWAIARIAFREAAKGLESLHIWASDLDPDNWQEAREAARTAARIYFATHATAYAHAHDYAADYAHDYAAAYAAAATFAAYATDYATAAIFAAYATDYATAAAVAKSKVRNEIVAIVLNEVERVLGAQNQE